MTIYNLGSINADYFYAVPNIPAPGETLAATALSRGLGGKGANMSVAAARAGSAVVHIGAVGPDGDWAIERLSGYGVGVDHIARVAAPTAHAVIAVDPAGENAIIIYPGANHAISRDGIRAVLAQAVPGDTLVMQNETLLQAFSAGLGSESGLRIAYAAAPFEASAVAEVLPFLDFLILNEIEAEQLRAATGKGPEALGVADVIVTLGSRGCRWFGAEGMREFQAVPVTAVDTTGAGDTFTGFVLAGRDQGMAMPAAIELASRAAALKVTRHGTADAIPTLEEVRAFRP